MRLIPIFVPILFSLLCQLSPAQNQSALMSNSSANTTSSPPAEQSGISPIFLFKCHGVLMTLAWVLFAPAAILFVRFQKDPLKRLLGEQLWFQVHRFLNTCTFLCALVAFLCVFSALQGTWVGPKATNPASANLTPGSIHALFGLLALLLVLGQPVGALFRCHPDSSSRLVFNFLHAAGGYLAWICAAVALSIACTTFHLFASPMAASILIFVFLALLLVCFSLMQFIAIQKSQLEIVEWIDQRQLFAVAAVVCASFATAIALLIVFA